MHSVRISSARLGTRASVGWSPRPARSRPRGRGRGGGMTRIKTGWRLAKDSWAVLRADRSLAIFPLLSFAFAAVAFALLIAPGIGAAAATNKEWPVVPFALIGSYAATFFSVYFNVALAGAATKSMQGHDTTLRDGLDVATRAARADRPLGAGPVGRGAADPGDPERRRPVPRGPHRGQHHLRHPGRRLGRGHLLHRARAGPGGAGPGRRASSARWPWCASAGARAWWATPPSAWRCSSWP